MNITPSPGSPATTQPAPVPVTVIGGFLGSGKTSLLNHILVQATDVRIGVLVNDFGAINIDAKLIVRVDGGVVDLANGCVCCSIRDDLMAACLQVLRRPDPPECLIIETSGVSDPVEVARTFDSPELQSALTIDSLVTVVDAERVCTLLQSDVADLVWSQLRVADLVVVNKVDLVDAGRLEKVVAELREIAPRSRMLLAREGQVPVEAILGASSAGALEYKRITPETDSAVTSNGHGHDLSTWQWTSTRPLSLPALKAVVEGLPETVYRAKGIVYLEELPPYKVALQMVGKRFNLRDLERWGTEPRVTQIVLIFAAGSVDVDQLERDFQSCIGTGDDAASPTLRLSRKLVPELT